MIRRKKSGLFGYGWFSPQLEFTAYYDKDGVVSEKYQYDPAGNILSKTVDGKTTTCTYDKANQLVSSTCDGKVTKYQYDAAGRLIKEGDKTYVYGWLQVLQSCQRLFSFYHLHSSNIELKKIIKDRLNDVKSMISRQEQLFHESGVECH